MRRHETGHDREPEPTSAGVTVAGPRGIRAVEALEHAVGHLRGHPLAVVLDPEQGSTVLGADGHHDARLRTGVSECVGEQVRQYLAEPVGVAVDDWRTRPEDAQIDRTVRCHGPCVMDGVGRQLEQVHALTPQRTVLVEPREQEQVLHQGRHPRGLASTRPIARRTSPGSWTAPCR